MKKQSVYIILLATIIITSCNNDFINKSNNNDTQSFISDKETELIIIGDKPIYGEQFSFNDFYSSYSRSTDSQLLDMVYFSVKPSNLENLHKINNLLGQLNPYELNKEILQTCDPDNLIFKTEADFSENNIDTLINFDTKYYYIEPTSRIENIKDSLEDFTVIEEFSIPDAENIPELSDEEISPVENDNQTPSRSIFSKSKVSGYLIYESAGRYLPANGITIRRVGLSGTAKCKVSDGDFSLGKVANLWKQYLWLDFNNSACRLQNLAGISASIFIKSGYPNKLNNVVLKINSNSVNGKITICNEILSRYKIEKTKRKAYDIPQAVIWLKESGNGTSSAPCLKQNASNYLPDIIFTDYANIDQDSLFVIHHEYTHFLHCFYAENKSLFWFKIISSELKSYSNKDETQNVNYNFKNKYVCFTENLAEWYCYIGLKNGPYGKDKKNILRRKNNYYDNVQLFEKLCENEILINKSDNITTSKKETCEERIIDLIKKYKIITFQEFYDAIKKDYPDNSSDLKYIFMHYYHPHANTIKF